MSDEISTQWSYSTVATVREVLDALNVINRQLIRSCEAFRFPIINPHNHWVAWSNPVLKAIDDHAEFSALECVIFGDGFVDPYYNDGSIQGRSVLCYSSNDLSVEAGTKVAFDLSKSIKPFFGPGHQKRKRGTFIDSKGTEIKRRIRV